MATDAALKQAKAATDAAIVDARAKLAKGLHAAADALADDDA